MSNIISIGWHICGIKWYQNYIAVAVYERRENDLGLLCAGKASKTKTFTEFFIDYIKSVKYFHPGFNFIFTYTKNNADFPDELIEVVKNNIITKEKKVEIREMLKSDCSEKSFYYSEVKEIYPCHSTLSSGEYKAALIAIRAIQNSNSFEFR